MTRLTQNSIHVLQGFFSWKSQQGTTDPTNFTFLSKCETNTSLQIFHPLFCGDISAAKDYFTKQNLLFNQARQNGACREATLQEDWKQRNFLRLPRTFSR